MGQQRLVAKKMKCVLFMWGIILLMIAQAQGDEIRFSDDTVRAVERNQVVYGQSSEIVLAEYYDGDDLEVYFDSLQVGDVARVDVEDVLNVRKSPSKESRVIAKLKPGTKVVVLEKDDITRIWVRVRVMGRDIVGWVHSGYLRVVKQEARDTPLKPGDRAVVDIDSGHLLVREQPHPESTTVGKLRRGMEVTVIESSFKTLPWVLIRDNTQKLVGWVNSRYLRPVSKGSVKDYSNEEEDVEEEYNIDS